MMKEIYNEFNVRFDGEPLIIFSPGRVNLIGEHTDYNNGFVLPAAINKCIVLAMAPNGSNTGRLFSRDMNEYCEVYLDDDLEKSDFHWANYIIGVADQLQKKGYKINGFDCVFGGNIPIGAGLSSSAALEGGVAYGLSQLFDLSLSKMEMTKISQKAENEFVGMQCGIMDQFASIHGKEGHVLKLDCRSLDYELYPFQRKDIDIILCDTGVHRELTSSEYNIRREQCEKGVKILQNQFPEVESLRDANIAMLEESMEDLSPVIYKRCRYVVEENLRVENACNALLNNDLNAFGKYMYQSHYGLRDQYEVSCRELDVLVEIAEEIEGVFGSRMMGGGFGGCTINLVEKNVTDDFITQVKRIYREKIGEDIEIYLASISDGTKHLSKETIPWN